MKNKLLIIVSFLFFTACDDFLEPRLSNELTQDQMYTQPGVIANLVYSAYTSFPNSPDSYGNSFLDCATDNALDSDENASTNKMMTLAGAWNSSSSILNNWSSQYDNINHINLFLSIGLGDDVVYYKTDKEKDRLLKERLKGEAYFLRAWVEFDLLRRYSGIDGSGQLMGFPIITEVQTVDNLQQLSRNTFDECVDQIVSDLDEALEGGLKDNWDSAPVYNDIVGDESYGRPTNIVCRALKARVLLYAASPAYTIGLSQDLIKQRYERAAQAAYETIQKIGISLPDLYDPAHISENYFNAPQNDEFILRRLEGGKGGASEGMAVRNFPPATGLLGKGSCNPSQNLVDAFPMANGYPIDHAINMGYSDATMYQNRDPRFYNTVLYNGAVFKDISLEMYPGGNCATGAENVNANEVSRTGYYLRKYMSPAVSLVAGNKVQDYHCFPLLRKVEVFLNFAEAANQAYGPIGGNFGFTAVDAIREVRRRAGIATGGTDGYLDEVSDDKESLDALIKNERRIELCFEGHRFFDLRRWKEPLNAPINGVVFSFEGLIMNRVTVSSPIYKDYMYYGPIPNNEILKTDDITQNIGW